MYFETPLEITNRHDNLTPKVSIIIPLYNAQSYIQECIESVLNQTYNNTEIIIVNDGSTDNSPTILKKYNKFITIINQQNKGAAAARNTGLKHATGYYIQFLDADDVLDQNKIASQMKIAKQIDYANDILIFGKWTTLGKDIPHMGKNQIAVWHSYQNPTDLLIDFAIIQCCLPPIVYLTPKRLIENAGIWDESLSMNDDGEFFARILKQTKELKFCSESISYYRSTPNSLSKRMSDKAATSQIESLIKTANIIKETNNINKDKAIIQLITSCLHNFYPYYNQQRKIGEQYLKKYQNYSIKYHRLNWKEWIYFFYKSLLK
jgi:glycosyltransferase involved in cell wall biosynthesis